LANDSLSARVFSLLQNNFMFILEIATKWGIPSFMKVYQIF